MALGVGKGLLGILRLGTDYILNFTRQNFNQPPAQDGVIVSDQDPSHGLDLLSWDTSPESAPSPLYRFREYPR